MKQGMEFWAGHVAAAKLEAISASEYARRHSLSVAALYYWQRKLKSITATGETGQASKFVALRVAGAAATHRGCLCALVLPSEMRLEMTSLPSPEWLAAIGRAFPGAR